MSEARQVPGRGSLPQAGWPRLRFRGGCMDPVGLSSKSAHVKARIDLLLHVVQIGSPLFPG